jgi:trehalose 6-phosphate synthase
MSRLFICSHRGPVSYQRVDGQLFVKHAGPGGLVPSISPALERFGGTWVYAATSDEDRNIAKTYPAGWVEGAIRLQILDLSPKIHREHYEVISTEYLGRLFHYLFDLPYAPVFDRRFMRAWKSYQIVNDRYAEAVLHKPRMEPVMIEDYHLMLVAAAVRRMRSSFDTPILYFHHVPWCEPDYFALLPMPVRDEILRSLLSYDAVGFHSRRWAQAFLACCESFLPRVVRKQDRIECDGRSTRILVAPAPLDVSRVTTLAESDPTHAWVGRLRERSCGRWTLVRVDRADLWKNALRGFIAFDALLHRRPELAKSVWFLALLTPTRTWIPEYRRYLRACQTLADRINNTFRHLAPSPEGPITLLVAEDGQRPDHDRALAGMRLADALLVNPIFDGLNLVAKEGMVVSENDAVLILSQNAGAYDELSEAAISINPLDVSETADAIERAFDMPRSERSNRSRTLRRIVASRGPEDWVRQRLEAVMM